MNIRDVLDQVDTLKPNQFDEAQKIYWISQLDRRVYLDVIKTHEPDAATPRSFAGYPPGVDQDTELLVHAPFDEVYRWYLEAMIDLANGEQGKYQNSMLLFNNAWADFARDYHRKHRPLGQRAMQFSPGRAPQAERTAQDALEDMLSAATQATQTANAAATKADQAGQSAQSAADAANAAAESVREKLEAGELVGPQGEKGDKGDTGAQGETGATYTPSVSAAGVISWTNNGGLPNPEPVNIKGEKGDTGPQGPAGTPGVSDLAYMETWYQGIDLTDKFATEIADYADPWAWIQARIRAGNYDQLHVCDYIPFTTANSRAFNAQIAGINTYKGYGDTEVGNHIDFITKELWPDSFQMNPVNYNNGTGSAPVPWLASNGYLYLNSLAGQVPNSTTLPLEMADVDYTAGGMYYYLPTALKNVIVEKRVYAPTRYSASGVLTNDNSGAWVNLGKLWLPDEYEITGARLMTSTGWFSGGFVQYPIFAHSMNRVKRANGSRSDWWTSSASAGGSTYFAFVNTYGLVSNYNASNAYRAPFCFRIS